MLLPQQRCWNSASERSPIECCEIVNRRSRFVAHPLRRDQPNRTRIIRKQSGSAAAPNMASSAHSDRPEHEWTDCARALLAHSGVIRCILGTAAAECVEATT